MFCVARCDLPEDVAKDPYCNYEIAERFMKANDHLGFFSMVYESGNYIIMFPTYVYYRKKLLLWRSMRFLHPR